MMASAHQICKLKHKAKALKKKQERSRSQMQVAKPNKPTQDPGDYLSKETIEANKRQLVNKETGLFHGLL